MTDVDPPFTHTHTLMHMNSYVGGTFLLRTKLNGDTYKAVASFPGYRFPSL